MERPRERLIENGSDNLSNEELIAILLKQGTKDKSAKEIALEVLKSVDDITCFKDLTIERLTNIKGIGKANASTLIAAIELGKRIYKNNKIERKVKLTNSKSIYEYIKYYLEDKKQEYFYAVYVNTKNEVIERKLLFMGTINHSITHPREVFKNAYLTSAAGIICVHNHPSGDITPSMEDIRFTNALIKTGVASGIPLLDHIIVGEESYYSFFDDGRIINM